MAPESKPKAPQKTKTQEEINDDKGKFPASVREELQKLNAFRCANPDCRQYTLKPKIDGGLYTTGQAAHIEGNGKRAARHNPNSTPEKRGSITNALWLCTRCHSMVDPDANRFPAPLLRRWKELSENVLNYSAPIMAFGNRCFFDGKSPWPPGPMALGAHLTIGPSNLDGICTESWIEGLSAAGKFKLQADRFYENKKTGRALSVEVGDDWHPFLTREGMSHLTFFSGTVTDYRQFLAYRVGVTYQISGRDFEFHSPWQLGGLTRFENELFYFNRKTGVLLAPWIDWIFANPGVTDAEKMLAIFNYNSLYILSYSWNETFQRNPAAGLVWKCDGLGVETCQGEIDGGVTFGFVQEAIKIALVVSTKDTPTKDLIRTDEEPKLIKITASK